jgi:hypothetical protein
MADEAPRKPKHRAEHLLTEEVQARILSFIRAGAFPHVAAEASGIPLEIWEAWQQMAKRPGRAAKRYRDFLIEVRQAQAMARVAAESNILRESPLNWLKSGPGRECANLAGWTAPTKPLVQNNTQVNLLLSPELQGLFAAILQVLAPYPEARAAVALALANATDAQPKKRGNVPELEKPAG